MENRDDKNREPRSRSCLRGAPPRVGHSPQPGSHPAGPGRAVRGPGEQLQPRGRAQGGTEVRRRSEEE